MSGTAISAKVTSQHLERKAVVYVRQSTDKQVQKNTESRRLQEGLVERARGLGFREVELVESDLGCSAGVGAARREGFDRLIASVAVGEVGIILSREVSRLVRTDKDWCRLIEVCQLFGTQRLPESCWNDIDRSKGAVRRTAGGVSGTREAVERWQSYRTWLTNTPIPPKMEWMDYIPRSLENPLRQALARG